MQTATPAKSQKPAANAGSKTAAARAATSASQIRLIRNLIWLYIFLWLIEGGLRRWILPGLASPLLLIRDPIAAAIYVLAFSNNVFPKNGFMIGAALLAFLSFVNAMVLGHGNPLVALYGVRCDFFHVPLIFIMGRVLRPKDLVAFSKVAVWVSIPYTALLVAQFYSPQDAWVNRGVGGNLDGAGFDGALDRYRPPGTFSFISGPAQLYPLFMACWFALLLARKLPLWLMVASGMSILITLPVSVSRTLFLSVAIVAAVGVGAMFVGGRFSIKLIIQFALAAAAVAFLASHSQVFKDGSEAFGARWEGATTNQGGFQEAIVDRALHDLFGAFGDVRDTGFGTGYSTNVGQQLAAQQVGFGASEAEWGRLLYDNGFLLGAALILYRVALAGALVVASLRAWKRRSPLSLVFTAACFLIVLNGQWGQTTTLGSSVIGGGLALAAAKRSKKIIKREKAPGKLSASAA
jgi:hypothetical protein